MSRINNTNPPGRGKELTSTALNQVFTEVNDAFPMNAENVRNEGLDQPSFDLDANDGKSGIILVAADEDQNNSSISISANTEQEPPFISSTVIHTWNFLQIYATNQIMRVYWQFENEVSANSYGSPIDADTNAVTWPVWLEWQLSSGGAWTPVPNQSDFEDLIQTTTTPGGYDIYGASSDNTYATTFVSQVYIHRHSATTDYDTQPARTGYGSWIYKADQIYVIYGLRLMCRGLLINFFNDNPDVGSPINSWYLVPSSASDAYTITIDASHIAYMIMEEQ